MAISGFYDGQAAHRGSARSAVGLDHGPRRRHRRRCRQYGPAPSEGWPRCRRPAGDPRWSLSGAGRAGPHISDCCPSRPRAPPAATSRHADPASRLRAERSWRKPLARCMSGAGPCLNATAASTSTRRRTRASRRD